MRKCRFCQQDISDASVVCEHCGRELIPGRRPSPPLPAAIAETIAAPKAKRNLYPIAIAVVAIAIVALIGYPYAKPYVDDMLELPSTPIAPDRPARHPKKFDGVYRASRALTGATEVGVNYARFSELLQTYASECAMADDAIKDDRIDRDVLSGFTRALGFYKTSGDVWGLKIRGAGSSFLYVDPDFAARLEESGIRLPTKNRLEDPDVALQLLWSKGRTAIEASNKRVQHE
jgi:hypothetical protein